MNLRPLASFKVNSLGLVIVELRYSSIKAAEAKDYVPAHKFTQPGITVIGSGTSSLFVVEGVVFGSSYTGAPDTAVEQRAAKIILENIQL